MIAAYSPHSRRVDRLATKIAQSRHAGQVAAFREQAERLIQRDQAELGNSFGQNVSMLFPMADVFVNVENPEGFRQATERFVDLVFGRPFVTPTRDEYSMFHARAAALRSADASRQVGAVIATVNGDVIAVGSNEVPKAGGGLYWSGDSPDLRERFAKAGSVPLGSTPGELRKRYELWMGIFEKIAKDAGVKPQ